MSEPESGPRDWTNEAAWVDTRRPVEAASVLPAEAYADADFFAEEQDRVFATSWVAVALVDEVGPGRLLVRNVGGKSVLITRDGAGQIRGFLNSCRHRGTELAQADCSVANTIRCPYHRWGYSLDGRLVATPRFDEAGVDGFDPADYPLHSIRIASSGCVVYACLDPTTPPLEYWLGDLEERLAEYTLHEWRTVETQTITIKANWKLIAENFQEYYHLTWVHPELAKVSRVDDHFRFQGPGMYCGQTTTPVSSDDRDDWTAMPASPGLNRSDAASGRFISIFPNLLLSVLPNHCFAMRLQPVDEATTIETCTWLVPATSAEVDAEAFDRTRQFWLDVNAEDIAIVERGQRGLTTGGYTPGRLSPRFEEPLHRFHNMVADRFVGVDRVPEGDHDDGQPRYGTGSNPLPYRPANPS
ncbi:MAG: aromatic ring-hydroxylating oxygenase subunit alpha [Acidimicrobiales bacterium]